MSNHLNKLKQSRERLLHSEVPENLSRGEETLHYLFTNSRIIDLNQKIITEEYRQKVRFIKNAK